MSEKPAQIEPARAHWVSSRDRAETRDALLDSARALIARDGAPALTLSTVAAEAGISRATMYGYFSGKAELLSALVARDEACGRAPEQDDAAVAAEAPASEPVCEPAPRVEDAAAIEPHPHEALVAEASPVAPEQAEARELIDEAVEPDPLTWMDYQPEALPEGQALEEEHADEQVAVAAEAPAPDAVEADADASAEPTPTPVEPTAEEAPAADEPAEPVATDAAVPDASPEPQEPAAQAEIVAEPDLGETLGPHEERRRLQAAHLEEIAKRLILPESALKEGTDAVIARLETRIRVIERSIANLETGQSAIGLDGEKKLKPVSDLVEHLRARADSTDARQLQSIAELRLSLHELTTRLNALDGVPHGAVSGTLAWPHPAVEPEAPAAVAAEPAPASAETDAAPETGEEATLENPKHAYLTAVRSLAKEGARQAAERETLREEEERGRRKHLIVAACVAAAGLAAVGVLFEFHPGNHGVSAVHAKPMPAAAAAKTPAHAALGLNTPLDRLTALAAKGDAEAELIVGLKYLEGRGAPTDAKEAARWLGKAATQGNPIAENSLGALYQNGRGVDADLGQAIHWYEASALQGNRHAMSNLAVLYAGGGGGPKNFAEAARWFQRSAALGFVDAQFDLAVLFERGDGVPQSLLDAYKWYAIAGRAGDASAKARADAIATQVSGDELAAAQKAAAEFHPQPMNGAANDVPTVSDVVAGR